MIGTPDVIPVPGQLWQLHRDNTNQLGVIATNHGEKLTFWPAVTDTELADESALIISSDDSGLLFDISVWPCIETGTTPAVLGFRLSTLLPLGEFLQLRQAYRQGTLLPVNWPRGKEPVGWMQSYLAHRSAFFGS